jgi:hypothetical protein
VPTVKIPISGYCSGMRVFATNLVRDGHHTLCQNENQTPQKQLHLEKIRAPRCLPRRRRRRFDHRCSHARCRDYWNQHRPYQRGQWRSVQRRLHKYIRFPRRRWQVVCLQWLRRLLGASWHRRSLYCFHLWHQNIPGEICSKCKYRQYIDFQPQQSRRAMVDFQKDSFSCICFSGLRAGQLHRDKDTKRKFWMVGSDLDVCDQPIPSLQRGLPECARSCDLGGRHRHRRSSRAEHLGHVCLVGRRRGGHPLAQAPRRSPSQSGRRTASGLIQGTKCAPVVSPGSVGSLQQVQTSGVQRRSVETVLLPKTAMDAGAVPTNGGSAAKIGRLGDPSLPFFDMRCRATRLA